MEITRETPINFITFSYQDQKNYLNNSVARMCMDSWKRAFPNLNIINIDVTEEIANMNEFSKFAYNQNLKSYTTDPLRLYYVNQYDNCVYCDIDVVIISSYINDLIKLLNSNNELIIWSTGTFTWNKHKNNQKYIKFYNFYNKFFNSNFYDSKKDKYYYTDNKMYYFYNLSNLEFNINTPSNSTFFICHINPFNFSTQYIYLYNNWINIAIFFLILKTYTQSNISNIKRLQNRNFN